MEKTQNAPRYYLPGQDEGTCDHIYRYIAIATGSEPGENGHPGLSTSERQIYMDGIISVMETVAQSYGVKILPGTGSLSYQEAVIAKVLGALLYRPFFIADKYDFYCDRFAKAMDGMMPITTGIPADAIILMTERAMNGQAIQKGQNGAREVFDDIGKQFQPFTMRTDKQRFGGLTSKYIQRMQGFTPDLSTIVVKKDTVKPKRSKKEYKLKFDDGLNTLRACDTFTQKLDYEASANPIRVRIAIRDEKWTWLRGAKITGLVKEKGVVKLIVNLQGVVKAGVTYYVTGDIRLDSNSGWDGRLASLSEKVVAKSC